MSAMVGTFDAPMSDYTHDLDVLMQAHSSDPWPTHEDGAMDDDLPSFPMTTNKMEFSSNIPTPVGDSMAYSASQGSTNFEIEVEMEDYIEDNDAEYEMLDDSEPVVEFAAELQDVEVNIHSSPIHSNSEVIAPDSAAFSAPLTLETSLSSASLVEVVPFTENYEIPHPEPGHFVDEVALGAAGVPAPPTLELAPDVPDSHGENSEPTSAAAYGAPEVPIEPVSRQDEQPTTVEELDHHVSLSLETTDLPLAHTEDATDHEASKVDLNPEEGVSTEEPPAHPEPAAEEEAEIDFDDSESNPHEIADGVCIEPPPAVVIHIASSHQPFVLFNRPPSSRAHTPTALDVDVPNDAVILLHDQPTLYYEPLSTLFPALREEGALQDQPHLHQAELGFHVDSLGLSIFEDNVYSREVSLHDLSILHDSFHTGLLRVQLLQQTPRFAIRYRELQEQLQRLGHDDSFTATISTSTNDMTGDQSSASREYEEPVDEYSHGEEPAQVQYEAIEQSAATEVEDPSEVAAEQVTEEHEEADAVEQEDSIPPPEENDAVHEESDDPRLDETGPEKEQYVEPPHDERSTDEPPAGPEDSVADGLITVPESNHPADDIDEGLEQHGYAPELPDEVNGSRADGDHVPSYSGNNPEPLLRGAAVDQDHQGDDDYSEYSSSHQEEDGDGLEDDPYAANFYEDIEDGPFEIEHSEEGTEQHGGQVHEHFAEPVAEHEEPSIDTKSVHSADDENGNPLPSTSATGEWSGEPLADESAESINSEALEASENTKENDVDNLANPDLGDGDEPWDDDLDGEGEAWDGDYEEQELEEQEGSVQSSVTLSSIRSKRSFHDFELDEDIEQTLTPSPGSKRLRLE